MTGQRRKSMAILAKPAGDGCNLHCRYCYVAGEPQRVRLMPAGVMAKMHVLASGYAETVNMSWHGGEPLLAGIEFHRDVVETQKRLAEQGTKFTNNVQSNFTLMTREFARLFKENGFTVGTSLDGMAEIHDQLRTYPCGKGTHADVMRGVEVARGEGLDVGVLAAYSKPMLGREMEVYDFMKEHRLPWTLNPLAKSGRGPETDAELYVEPLQWAEAVCRIFDRYIRDRDSPKIATVDDRLKKLFDGAARERNADADRTRTCQRGYLCVDSDGKAYPCHRFSTDETFVLGSIGTDSLDSMMEHPLKKQMVARTFDAVEGCGDCDYKRACDCGCPYDAMAYNGSLMARDYFCEAYKAIFSHMLSAIKELKKRGVENGRE